MDADTNAEAVSAPTGQLLDWIDAEPRGYAETIERWKTSCPRLAVWEDALADGLVRIDGLSVTVTSAGKRRLHELHATVPVEAIERAREAAAAVSPERERPAVGEDNGQDHVQQPRAALKGDVPAA